MRGGRVQRQRDVFGEPEMEFRGIRRDRRRKDLLVNARLFDHHAVDLERFRRGSADAERRRLMLAHDIDVGHVHAVARVDGCQSFLRLQPAAGNLFEGAAWSRDGKPQGALGDDREAGSFEVAPDAFPILIGGVIGPRRVA